MSEMQEHNLIIQHHQNDVKLAIGAVLESFNQLKWRVYDLQIVNNQVPIPYLKGASESEQIEVFFFKNSIQINSKTIGVFTQKINLNEKNIEEFKEVFYQKIEEEKESLLLKSFQSFLKKEHLKYENGQFRKEVFSDVSFWTMILRSFDKGSTTLMTSWLILINFLVFVIAMILGANIFEPSSEIMIKLGANYTEYILQHQYWRFFTSCFLHFGLAHLLSNLMALLFAGMILEQIAGSRLYLFCYIASGIFASATSYFVHPYTVSAGASGAIFGIFGFMLGLVSTPFLQKEYRNKLAMYLVFYVGVNLAGGLMEQKIDNAAHLGGLLSGIIFSWISMAYLKNPENEKIKRNTYIFIALFTIAYCALLVIAKPYYFSHINSITLSFSDHL